MKRKMILLSAMVFATAAILLAIPMGAMACMANDTAAPSNPYSGAWQPTDDSVFLVELSHRHSSGSLYIYDFHDPANGLMVLNDGRHANTNIYFSSTDNGDGSVSWYADTMPNGNALAFSGDPLFGFLFCQGSSNWQQYDLSGTGGAFHLSETNTGMTVLVHDAQMTHAPIPGAVFLLGSGLIGIVTLKRRQKIASK